MIKQKTNIIPTSIICHLLPVPLFKSELTLLKLFKLNKRLTWHVFYYKLTKLVYTYTSI